MLRKRCFNELTVAPVRGLAPRLRMNHVAPVGSEITYWLLRTRAERRHSGESCGCPSAGELGMTATRPQILLLFCDPAPIAAVVRAPIRMRRDSQHCRNKTGIENGAAQIHGLTPVGSIQLRRNRLRRRFGLPAVIPAPSQSCSPSVSAPNQSHDQQ